MIADMKPCTKIRLAICADVGSNKQIYGISGFRLDHIDDVAV